MDDLTQRIALLEAQLASILNTPVVQAASTAADLTLALQEAIIQLAPLKSLLEDDSINDILINGPQSVYIERHGKMERTDLKFENDAQVFAIARAIAAQAGRPVAERRPITDARLPDGSRVNIIGAPLSVDGTAISIRKFARETITLDDMAARGNISQGLAEFLKVMARCHMNVVISGGTGAGKTTLLNAMAQHIDVHERIVTIEDAAELRLPQPHVVRLETRPQLSAGWLDERVTIRDLVVNALRMRPDRIIVGEVRGPEAFDMLQAMNTGHEGSFTTIHANHPRDALARIENMVNMANLNLPPLAVRQQMASAVQLIVQVSRMRDGHRRITYVSEIVGTEGDIITMQDLFTYQNKGEGKDGKLQGEFKWTGIMPRFLRRVAYYGEYEHLAHSLGVKLPKL